MTIVQTSSEDSKQSVLERNRDIVVAVHGSASTGGQWRSLIAELSPNFDVITPDLPGYGRQQGFLPTAKPSLTSDALCIERIVQQANAPVHIVAHSYGAAVAMAFAINRPNAIASLTLIEPALFHLLRNGSIEDMHHFTEISSVGNAVRIASQIGDMERGMSRFVDYWNGAGTWVAMKPTLRAALAAQTAQVARNFAAAFAETWPVTLCDRISCPTVLVSADQSRPPAQRVTKILAGALPQARHIAIADAGHMVPVTHPNVINPLIAEALAATVQSCNEASQREAA